MMRGKGEKASDKGRWSLPPRNVFNSHRRGNAVQWQMVAALAPLSTCGWTGKCNSFLARNLFGGKELEDWQLFDNMKSIQKMQHSENLIKSEYLKYFSVRKT
ncbi:hypothetical protein CDAR_192111 [Caerostris darwini]|uniref:Uncharacterized protein n=1 Tax=Caerostris darwini TaxID=1538125 RepID=A0AAV4PHY9_9ARAC|nr:hypothetical protein CDAR_192111 [Caerostris darwini]